MAFYVEPVGQRSCCRDHLDTPAGYQNRWINHNECEEELELLRQSKFDEKMTVPEQIDALAILEGLIEGGVNADLRFPTAYSRRVEVEVDTISQPGRTYMLELRHVPDKESKKLFGKVKRVIRLYYFEPSQLPRTLAGLKLGSKPGDAEDRMGEQDSHIDDAHARCTSWVDDGMDTGGGENNDEIVSKP